MNTEHLKPTERLLLMDLLEQIGFDVSDWGNYQRGEKYAASNPKYCYEWTFEDNNKQLLAFNLWYDNLEIRSGEIIQRLNMRKTAEGAPSSPQRRRAYEMDFALQKAARLNWPLRVIICDGIQRKDTVDKKRAKAATRMLDSTPWSLDSYDSDTGDAVLIRGAVSPKYVDQFDAPHIDSDTVKKHEYTSLRYSRSPLIRKQVLERSKGNCEFCGAQGFVTSSGSTYLETHHITPLSESGEDTCNNVIALCANDHRRAHFGEQSALIRKQMTLLITERTAAAQTND